MTPAHLLALLACARAAELFIDDVETSAVKSRGSRAIGPPELPHSCMYEGRWFADGATVRTREACLLCSCTRGALSCRRRACAPLPEPPPRCHILHRKGECCPELHCPDRIVLLEHGASARFDDDDHSAIATPASIRHACVEGGIVYAAGSAMSSTVACEQCFCLGGARKCVRPRCLPPPLGCKARPAPGACCPQRYYCEHVSTRPPDRINPNDCAGPNGKRVPEGERVVMDIEEKCTQCFCLRGSVRCQHLSCAPPLLGCTPLVQPGQCCPHQYQCDHLKTGGNHPEHLQSLWYNSLVPTKNEDRSFHSSKSTKREANIKLATTVTDQTTLAEPTMKNFVTTAKVKRKTDDIPSINSTSKTTQDDNPTTSNLPPSSPKVNYSTTKMSATEGTTTASQEVSEEITTEQPEATVKIMINGTINCTTELSSTSLALNITNNTDTEKITLESEPRVPYIDISNLEAHTLSPVDIITDRYAGFDENETFTINVTSSLRTNSSHSTTTSTTTVASTKAIPTVLDSLLGSLNITKKRKEDYDYDYTEPTLPPSLPNLKIIPFVAADAVVEDDISSKESLTYPVMEREDKFPVYYPSVESKDSAFPTRREDIYPPTQYPVFISKKVESPKYPVMPESDLTNIGYPGVTNDLSSSVHEYTVTASLGSHHPEINKAETKIPTTSPNFEIETPAVNLFSPPVETEGGFIPKGPGIIDEYYAVYPSTPSGPVVPHLTTSMQLDTDKDECTSNDGRRVQAGDTVSLACSVCTCAWGELHCSPRPCHTPPGCLRRPPTTNSVDLCCGELICDLGNKTTPAPLITTKKVEIALNETKVLKHNDSETYKFNNNETTRYTSITSTVATITSKAPDVSIHQNNKTYEATAATTREPLKATENVTTTTTTAVAPIDKDTESYNHSLEYDEEDDDEGFSFGSVLKLLLSDNYDTTTASPQKKKTTQFSINTTVHNPATRTTTFKPVTPPKLPHRYDMDPFVPVTQHYAYTPPNKLLQQNSIKRIDHLVLGEAMAIRTTPRPTTTSTRSPPVSTRKPTTTARLPPRPTTGPPVELKEPEHPLINEVPRPPANALGVGPGLLKLAGCNIYGRMYRVGRIIAELSTPCQECRCTEVGVQCRPLTC